MIIIKKTIIIFIIIITISIILLFVTKNKTNINQNEYKYIPFYKSTNLNRYRKYQLKNKKYSKNKIVLDVNMNLDKDFYTNINPAKNINTTYILVNKYYYLEKNYIPDNLEKIDNSMIVNTAKEAFEEMRNDIKKQNLNIVIISGYRNYNYQKKLYNSYKLSDGEKTADTYSARAGFSEHQTGLAIDISNGKTIYTNFMNTKEYLWMLDNAYKYGFILRYPEKKEHITGYIFEPWHYRYVGIEIATHIKKHNITFDEYYAMFIDKS